MESLSSSKYEMYIVETYGVLPLIANWWGACWEPAVGGRQGKLWPLTAVWILGYMEQEFPDV